LLEALREVPAAGWRPLRSRLTNREWEIIELLAEDATIQLIAEQLVLSPVTVYSHIKSLLRSSACTPAGTPSSPQNIYAERRP
jgi:NarL family two-component system response regulator LiaR